MNPVMASNEVEQKLPHLNVQVDPAVATTEDIITFSIILSKPSSYKDLSLPEIGGNFAGLRVVEFGTDDPEKEEDRVILKKWYKLQGDISGQYILPSITLDYEDLSGKKRSIKTSEVFIEINPLGQKKVDSTEQDAPKDIRDIKKLSSLGMHPLWKLVIALGTLIFILVLVLIISKRIKKKQKPIPVIPPHERALDGLRQLASGIPSEADDFKGYYFKLSDITKQYVEGRFSIPATDRTTEELEVHLGGTQDLSEGQGSLFLKILKRSDRVKFTDYLPSQEKARDILNDAVEFVEATKPASSPSDHEVEEDVI
jgi:hypothetical protein